MHVKFVLDSLEAECFPDFVSEFYATCSSVSGATTQGQSTVLNSSCLSYKEIPFERHEGTIKVLLDLSSDVLSAADEAGACHVCGVGPLDSHPAAKELTLFTQYQRKRVYGESVFFFTSS